MEELKKYLENRLPPEFIVVLRRGAGIISNVKRCFIYTQYDSSTVWRSRAQGTGQSRVLWANEGYNQLYRRIQRDVLKPYLLNLNNDDTVLDIGCGIGIVAKMMADINPKIKIDAVDFHEMIGVAKKENQGPQIHYIASSAENYLNGSKQYDFILSSACFSMIRNVKVMEKAMDNCLKMLAEGAVILLIDPFHRWNYLARVKYSTRQVIRFMRERDAKLIMKSGVLFWPYRDWICNSDLSGEELEKRFLQGERLLSILGKHVWADYKILAFQKIH